MAVIRQPSLDPTGTTYLRVLADELGTNQISELIIHCSNGKSYNATVAGGTTGNYRSTTQTFTGLTPGTTYSFWGTGKTTGGTAINIPTEYFATAGDAPPPPDPDPSITSLSVTGTGTINATWSVGNASYLRSYDSFRVYMSGANNTTQYDMGHYNSSTRLFANGLSGNGSALVVGARYYVWVYAYNSAGKTFGTSASAIFSRPKPDSFNWDVAKTFGGTYNLTYSEWDGLLDSINEFRAYKGLVTRTFSRSVETGVISGYVVPSATSFNAARNAINDMNPSVGVPSAVASGQRITATLINGIRNSLNSVT